MNNYLNCKSNFPWKYSYKQKIINKIRYKYSIIALANSENQLSYAASQTAKLFKEESPKTADRA